MGQPEEVVALSKGYYVLTSLSVIPFIVFMTFKQYMEGIGNTKVAMVITISCNIMNIILNYIFIYGKFGAPALGVAGAGLATLVSRFMMPWFSSFTFTAPPCTPRFSGSSAGRTPTSGK